MFAKVMFRPSVLSAQVDSAVASLTQAPLSSPRPLVHSVFWGYLSILLRREIGLFPGLSPWLPLESFEASQDSGLEKLTSK